MEPSTASLLSAATSATGSTVAPFESPYITKVNQMRRQKQLELYGYIRRILFTSLTATVLLVATLVSNSRHYIYQIANAAGFTRSFAILAVCLLVTALVVYAYKNFLLYKKSKNQWEQRISDLPRAEQQTSIMTATSREAQKQITSQTTTLQSRAKRGDIMLSPKQMALLGIERVQETNWLSDEIIREQQRKQQEQLRKQQQQQQQQAQQSTVPSGQTTSDILRGMQYQSPPPIVSSIPYQYQQPVSPLTTVGTPTRPLSMWDATISDEQALDDYLRTYSEREARTRRQQEIAAEANQPAMMMMMMGSPTYFGTQGVTSPATPFGPTTPQQQRMYGSPYTPAASPFGDVYGTSSSFFGSPLAIQKINYRVTPVKEAPLRHAAAKAAEGAPPSTFIDNEAAYKLLEELDIVTDIDRWSENLRKWFVKILTPLNARIQEVDSLLAQQQPSMEAYSCKHALSEPLPPGAPTPPGTPMLAMRDQLTLQRVLEANKTNILFQERLKLENFLAIPDCPRLYLLERLKVLVEGGYLAKYKWDSGMPFQGKEWNEKDFPADAHIIMHLFCRYFDQLLPADPLYGNTAFSRRHFVRLNEKQTTIDTSVSALFICQTHTHPPHFKLVASGEVLEILQGRNNAFHCIIMLLYHIKTEYSGYFETIDLSGMIQEIINDTQ